MQDSSSKSDNFASRSKPEGQSIGVSPAPTGKPEDGAHDRSLIRWSLSLEAEERLAVLQDFVDTFWTPRHG